VDTYKLKIRIPLVIISLVVVILFCLPSLNIYPYFTPFLQQYLPQKNIAYTSQEDTGEIRFTADEAISLPEGVTAAKAITRGADAVKRAIKARLNLTAQEYDVGITDDRSTVILTINKRITEAELRDLGKKMYLYSNIPLFIQHILPYKKVNLGLDLQGGVYLVIQVDTEQAVDIQLENIFNEFKRKLSDKKIDFLTLRRVGRKTFKLTLLTNQQKPVVDKLVQDNFSDLEVVERENAEADEVYINVKDKAIHTREDYAVDQALKTIRNRIDEFGVAEPQIQRQGFRGKNIIIQLPGVEDFERVSRIIREMAQLEFKLVLDVGDTREDLLSRHENKIPENAMVLVQSKQAPSGQEQTTYFLLTKESNVTGEDLINAQPARGELGQWEVHFELSPSGARRFAKLTGENVNKRLAIVLDKKVQSAPVISTRIEGRGSIEGNFSEKEAKDLSLILRAGSLPAPIKILENRTVGPSLGKDSITLGVRSSLIGGLLVLAFMLIYYKLSGVIADFALLVNLLIITAVLALFHATLTLPGIAGIILTIGMSVDANVLIFERIKEELRLGRSVSKAVELGFSKAIITIVDANVTTIIAAFALYQFGTGPIQGFAVTLFIGILSSMFTAIFISRSIFFFLLAKYQPKSLSI